jgi:hypothetical protein
MGHHTMTEVQTMTINQGLQGTDMWVHLIITVNDLLWLDSVLRKHELVQVKRLASSSRLSRTSSERILILPPDSDTPKPEPPISEQSLFLPLANWRSKLL